MKKAGSHSNSLHHLSHGSLKDFFIPHSGNNYKPKSLHPKRVLFHITAALVVKAIVLLFVAYYPISAWMTPDVAAGEAQKIISLTNSLRASLSLGALKENYKLDSAANKKVQDMFINQYFAHHSPNGLDMEDFLHNAGYTNYATVGENLAMGYDNAADVMAAWEKSPTHYDNLVDPNFNEIGISLGAGQYQNKDTVFIAQYFGLPNNVAEAVATTPKKTIEKVVTSSNKTVLAQKTAAPVAPKQTKVTVSQTATNANEKIVKVETVLPAQTKAATAQVLNKDIPLTQQANNTWLGTDLVQNDVQVHAVVPASLSVTDQSGQIVRSDIATANIVPEKQSVLDQYWLYRTHPNQWMSQIFNVSSIYFKIILLLAVIALALTIFIERKKQHPRLIVSGLGLILCLVFLIIF